jgi:hypothetical protein
VASWSAASPARLAVQRDTSFDAAVRITSMLTRSMVAALGVTLAGCAPAVQRGVLTPVFADVKKEASEPARAPEQKLVFRSPAARVHVFSNDLLNGDHHLNFSRVRGTYRIDRASGRARLHVEVRMRAFQAESGWITSFAGRMLDVAGHPVTVIDARVEPIEGEPNRRLVTGNVRLRGIERGIQFRADVTPTADGIELHAAFDMSRSAFGVRAGPGEGDALIRDDFTVTLHFRATPERVRIEEVEDPPPPVSPDVEWPTDEDG